MLRVCRLRNERPLAQTQEIVLAHDAKHALSIGYVSDLTQFDSYPPMAVEPLLKRNPLHGVTNDRLFLPRRRRMPMPVVTSSTDTGQRAQALNREIALLHRDHRFDDGVDGFASRPPFDWRFAPTCRKAR